MTYTITLLRHKGHSLNPDDFFERTIEADTETQASMKVMDEFIKPTDYFSWPTIWEIQPVDKSA